MRPAPQGSKQQAEPGLDVLFAVLPFADLGRPAIGVSLLAAELEQQGHSAGVRYFNFDLAEAIGHDTYLGLANTFPPDTLIGEWFFADLLFDDLPPEEEYVSRILARYGDRSAQVARILAARSERERFVRGAVEEIRAARPKIVGFTTTFHQTCACLAVARRLKELPEPPLVVFGGANCEGEMGAQIAAGFPYVDYVCIQEGDYAFPSFVERYLGGEDSEGAISVPGIVSSGRADLEERPPLVQELDELPVPRYGDYFARLERSPLATKLEPEVLIETSRGCWWGAKRHCTFCGLNGATMAFRSKSPERVFDELSELWRTYGIRKVESVDNILDHRYITTLFPRLAASELDLQLFYEVKANLRHDQLATLRAGGMISIQPGIESFSSEVLKLMDKGCTGFQNIQLLRWCEELGIETAWNILYGFPGESAEEYERMAELLPLLTHLRAPASCAAFRLDRFSPFYMRSAELGIEGVRPAHAYYYVFPFGRRELARLAYYFDFDFADGREPDTYARAVSREVARWWNAYNGEPGERPVLDARVEGDSLRITDTRSCAAGPELVLEGVAAEIYLLCDRAQSLGQLKRRLSGRAAEEEVLAILAELEAKKLLIHVDERYASLAVIRDRPEVEQGSDAILPLQTSRAAPAHPGSL